MLEATSDMEMWGFLEGVKRVKILLLTLCREEQKDLADSYEEMVAKGLEISARIIPIRSSSDKINSDSLIIQLEKRCKRNMGL